MPGRIEFDVNLGRAAKRRDDSAPMRLLVIGDFSGKPIADRPPLAGRATHAIDVDSLDKVMGRLAPRVRVPQGEIQFTSIDDFHPDRLSTRLEPFQGLREKRAHPPAENDDMLARLLGRAPSAEAAPAARPSAALDALIHDVIAPHIVQDRSAHIKPYVEAIDAALTEQMRAVLHDAAFQSLEATWRGVHWLMSNLELDEDLQLHLLDVSRDEILGDVVAAKGKIAETGLYRALVDRWRNVPGGQGWSAIVTLMQFDSSDTDVGLLAALGLVASQAGGPLLGGAEWKLASNNENASPGWNALRHSEAAPWIALAAPRVLLRLPYGKRTDAVEAFPFEEFAGSPEHDRFLWGTASLALALLIGRGFRERGWDMELGDEREIGELPAYTFERDGEMQLQPCAEHFLSESSIQKVLDAGIIPIASRRDRNAVVAIRFQSIADPPAALSF